MFTASVGHLTMILRATAPPTVAATAPPLHTRSSNIYTYFNIGLSMCAPPLTFSLSCESPSFLLGRFAWLCVQTCVCSRKGASEQATTSARASKPFRSAFTCVQFLGCNSNAGTDPHEDGEARACGLRPCMQPHRAAMPKLGMLHARAYLLARASTTF